MEVIFSSYYYRDEFCETLSIDGITPQNLVSAIYMLLQGVSLGVGEIEYDTCKASHTRHREQSFDVYLLKETGSRTLYRGCWVGRLSIFVNGRFIHKIRNYSDYEDTEYFLPIAKKLCEALDIKDIEFYTEHEETIVVRKKIS